MAKVFGYQKASSELPHYTVDFECSKCGEFQSSPGQNGFWTFTRRNKDATTTHKYNSKCPTCGAWCEVVTANEPPEGCGVKPTKRKVVGDHVYHVHGRDRNVYPADLADVIAKSNALFKEQGYDIGGSDDSEE